MNIVTTLPVLVDSILATKLLVTKNLNLMIRTVQLTNTNGGQ